MADLKQIPIQSEAEKTARLVHELTNAAASIVRGEVSADCFLLITMDSRLSPPPHRIA